MVESRRRGSCLGLFRLIPCERTDHTWAFPLHVYLYKNYNPNYKWKITVIRILHHLQEEGILSYNVTYLWQLYHILLHISNKIFLTWDRFSFTNSAELSLWSHVTPFHLKPPFEKQSFGLILFQR
jgi:hypothetical protein